ncbi:histidine kinase dimerization/phospho-acceptor domain-containing protein [Filifactor alocis]|uniref:histidine kinase dimerization/phospho-acceptor domain-containing protein n=1 Tax=Filifactor alocis TaxID=143361 RepID=UPI003C6FFB6C
MKDSERFEKKQKESTQEQESFDNMNGNHIEQETSEEKLQHENLQQEKRETIMQEEPGIASEEIAFQKTDEEDNLFRNDKNSDELSFLQQYRIKKQAKKQQLREDEYHYRTEKKLQLEREKENDKKKFFASSWRTVLVIFLISTLIVGIYPFGIRMIEGPDNERLERYLKTDEFIVEEFQSNMEFKLEKRQVLRAVDKNQEQKDLLLQRMNYQRSSRYGLEYDDLMIEGTDGINNTESQENTLSRYYISDASNHMIQTNMTKEEIESLENTPKILSVSFRIDNKGRLADCKIDSKYPSLISFYTREVNNLFERYAGSTIEKDEMYELVASMYNVRYFQRSENSDYDASESSSHTSDMLRVYHDYGSENNFYLNGDVATVNNEKELESDKKLIATINQVVKQLETLPKEEISVTFYVPASAQEVLETDDYYHYYESMMEQRAIFVLCLAAIGIFLMMLLAGVVPFRQQRNANIVSKFNHIPLELKLFLTTGMMGIVCGIFVFGMQVTSRENVMYDSKELTFIYRVLSGNTPEYFGYAMMVAFLGLLFVYLYMTYLKYIYYCGIIEGLIKNSIFGRVICYICRMMITPFKKMYMRLNRLQQIDLEGSFKKKMMGLWAFHCVFLLVVIALFGMRPELAIILLLGYVVLVFRWIYRFLLQLAYIQNYSKKLAEGNFNLQADENIGIFSKTAQYLNHIKTGFKTALEEEVRSQNMKTELISNVSHDLKTPLTSIINYSDLLKQPNLTKEQQEEYIDTIYKKSQRLKVLIEDLFEASKASSGNIKLQTERLDIVSVFRQTMGELEEKIQFSKLDFRLNLPKEPVYCMIDGKRTYRVFSNIISNITKYSLKHTRVYIDVTEQDKSITFEFKNISSYEMNFAADEIMERFKRGDESRNTEGSGLGLSIAKSLTELQGGSLEIEIDGDLFKLFVSFPKEK